MSLRVFGSSSTLFAIFVANISKSTAPPHAEHHHSKKKEQYHHHSHQFQYQQPKSRYLAFSKYNRKIGDESNITKSKSKNSKTSKRK
ncbi:17709_t:CDS:2 [Funneliformis geosporum]|uniref:3459_t:CDS:1 n=1 Tax=Funneliformis geosporum TaxID=1117311 RepID=A0A9W4SIW7_9GLOM|nr:17709_t:CDS:2 [Funneliformis geosporum]CAI2170690.1 3459_t:CDS:2 [Funneliformis geosporum]